VVATSQMNRGRCPHNVEYRLGLSRENLLKRVDAAERLLNLIAGRTALLTPPTLIFKNEVMFLFP
jgi:hypothetical protein